MFILTSTLAGHLITSFTDDYFLSEMSEMSECLRYLRIYLDCSADVMTNSIAKILH